MFSAVRLKKQIDAQKRPGQAKEKREAMSILKGQHFASCFQFVAVIGNTFLAYYFIISCSGLPAYLYY
jgi:hypothetical protein